MITQVGGSTLGSDPELFAEMDGRIVGSEKVIPEIGVFKDGHDPEDGYYKPFIVRDGVQIELHPSYGYYASGATHSLAQAFQTLKSHLDKTPNFKACFKPVIEVSREEMDTLTVESRQLGCQESFNVYGLGKIEVDGNQYLKRSAGGHIHMGLSEPIYASGEYGGVQMDHRTRLVPICDYILGNTCVLIDRDPNQVERRKLYGRGGEYRLPEYGLEYRTLSNFWLRCPELAQLVFGLAEMAVGVLGTTLVYPDQDLEKELLTSVDSIKVLKAIQRNDLNLATENWIVIREFIRKHALGKHVLNEGNLDKFDRFLSIVAERGLDVFWPEDPVERWNGTVDGEAWVKFIDSIQLPKKLETKSI